VHTANLLWSRTRATPPSASCRRRGHWRPEMSALAVAAGSRRRHLALADRVRRRLRDRLQLADLARSLLGHLERADLEGRDCRRPVARDHRRLVGLVCSLLPHPALVDEACRCPPPVAKALTNHRGSFQDRKPARTSPRRHPPRRSAAAERQRFARSQTPMLARASSCRRGRKPVQSQSRPSRRLAAPPPRVGSLRPSASRNSASQNQGSWVLPLLRTRQEAQRRLQRTSPTPNR
jgi:hypothetical protein